MQYDKTEYLKMYRQLYFARHYEMKIEEIFLSGKLPGFYHLSIGQEAIQTGVLDELGPNDWWTPHFRVHPTYAQKVGIKDFTAEMTAKAAGPNHGWASYAHLTVADKKVGPSNGMLGEAQAIATGIAHAYKVKKVDGCVVIGAGDGSMQEGLMNELLNIIAAWKLPVAWYVENNDIAISTKISEVTGTPDLADRGKGFGIPSASYDGDDVLLVREVMHEAIEKARRCEPTISVFRTSRWRGHFIGDQPDRYRDQTSYLEEVQAKHDPVRINKNYLLNNGIATEAELAAEEKKAMETIEEAIEYADSCPAPTREEILSVRATV